MTGVIDLAWIGTILRTIQAEQRFIRGKSQLILSALNEAITLLMQRIGNFAGVHGYPDPIEPALLSGGAAEPHHERPLSTILLMLPKPLVKAIESISARRNSISNRDYQATDRNGTGREATPAK